MSTATWLWLCAGMGLLAYGAGIAVWVAGGIGAVIANAVMAIILGSLVVAALHTEEQAAKGPPQRGPRDPDPWDIWRWQ